MSSRFRKLESRQWVPNPVEDVAGVFEQNGDGRVLNLARSSLLDWKL